MCSHGVVAEAFATAIREGLRLPADAYANGIAGAARLFSLSGTIAPKILSTMYGVGNLHSHDQE